MIGPEVVAAARTRDGGSLPFNGSAGASPVGVNIGGASATGGNTGGGAIGQDDAVVYIPGGLRTRCCPCPRLYMYTYLSIY